MPSLQNVAASFLHATNENNASLANIKFDFSLVRVDAPTEWLPIGSALNQWRRADAEMGPVHRTARRLAALFEQRIPSTPKLVAAYGTRVSEIISYPGINPSGSASDGPFRSFVGADGTALWAAATSGANAIAIYLLACFLARAWDAQKAVSIWVELVTERRAEIQAAFQDNENVNESTLLSTLQDISRDDLALWDASARSWLRSADQAKQWHLKQLQLITNDMGLQVNGGSSTFLNVINSWTQAMTGVENFLAGMPQQINDASIILALSAWHLFPDLVALASRTTKIPFHDSLFPSNALGTVGGFTLDRESPKGIQWSLTLSHLHYYGSPVETTSRDTQPRVTFSQLRLVALGCMFYKWRVNQRHFIDAANFLTTIWDILLKVEDGPPGLDVKTQFKWLHTFVTASQDLLDAYKDDRVVVNDCQRLVAFGYRRGWDFLGPAEEPFEPFFGLCNVHVLEALQSQSDLECGLAYLHSIAQANNLADAKGIIVRAECGEQSSNAARILFTEVISVRQHPFETRKRSDAGNNILRYMSPCWLEAGSQDPSESTLSSMSARRSQLTQAGYMPLSTEGLEVVGGASLVWSKCPRLFFEPHCTVPDDLSSTRASLQHGPCNCFEPHQNYKTYYQVGDWRFGMCADEAVETRKSVTVKDAATRLRDNANPSTLWTYIAALVWQSWKDVSSDSSNVDDGIRSSSLGILLCSKPAQFSQANCRALHSLALANDAFAKIDHPVITLDCIFQGMHEVSWTPSIASRGVLQQADIGQPILGNDHRMHTPIPINLSRAAALSCLIFFDSGNVDLDPDVFDHTFAVSSGNSLYVAAVILSDPGQAVADHDIRHIVGNIGRRGISLLVAPQNPQIRPLGSDYRLINHEAYDNKREDNFTATSLHLRFTEWTQAIVPHDSQRTIDRDVYYVESVISVSDGGSWVADLDILGIDQQALVKFAGQNLRCLGKEHFCHKDNVLVKQGSTLNDEIDLTSIDSWEEFLDYPVSTSIFRAHGNWAARLAATAILFQRGLGHCVGLLAQDEPFCLQCMQYTRERELGATLLNESESSLPHFCID